MARITLYITQETERKVREEAASRGISVSRFVAGLIERRVAREWPDEVAALAGAWPDLPDVENLRSGQPKDVERNRL